MELHHYLMELRGTLWHSMELHRYSMDTPWEFRGIPWISIDFHVFPWISMEFRGGILHGSPQRTLFSSW